MTVPEAEPTFDASFAALAQTAHRVAYRLLGNRPEAEDVAQEALARAYVRWRSVRDHAEPWVARVAANLALDVLRRRRRAGVAPVASAESYERHTLDRMVVSDLLRALPRRQREVLVLRYLADLSEADTAVALGCSLGSVKRHTHRALARLRADPQSTALGGDLDVRPS